MNRTQWSPAFLFPAGGARFAAALACTLLLAAPLGASAREGDLAPSFGAGQTYGPGHIALTPSLWTGSADDTANAVAVQPDGKIVGRWYAYAYAVDASGTIIPGFVLSVTPFGDNSIRRALIQRDGKVVLTGTSGWDDCRGIFEDQVRFKRAAPTRAPFTAPRVRLGRADRLPVRTPGLSFREDAGMDAIRKTARDLTRPRRTACPIRRTP